jgi:ADP-heptose:LPS heptosyltransferase
MVELGIGRIAVVRALKGLGDFLCVVPALRALRVAAPGAHITLIGLVSSQALVRRFNSYIDELLPFPGFPGIPEAPLDVPALPAFFAAAQARSFDLALQMHGNGGLTNPFTVMLGAANNAGYYSPGGYCPDLRYFLPLNESDHEVRRWIRLLSHIGVPGAGEWLEFPLQPSDWQDLRSMREAVALAGAEYVAIHPGASEPARRWSPRNFAAVADHFARIGYRVVLTGTPDEADIANEVEAGMRWGAVNLAGRTTLGAMAALLSGARLVVSNDTGVSHLAAALQVPSVIVFIASDPQRWAPLNGGLHRVAGGQALQPRDVSPLAVIEEAQQLLRRRPASKTAGRKSPEAAPPQEVLRA